MPVAYNYTSDTKLNVHTASFNQILSLVFDFLIHFIFKHGNGHQIAPHNTHEDNRAQFLGMIRVKHGIPAP